MSAAMLIEALDLACAMNVSVIIEVNGADGDPMVQEGLSLSCPALDIGPGMPYDSPYELSRRLLHGLWDLRDRLDTEERRLLRTRSTMKLIAARHRPS